MTEEKDSDWYRKMCYEHFHKYECLAQRIGIERLTRLVPATLEVLTASYETDPHLNNIPLAKWDSMDSLVRRARASVSIHGSPDSRTDTYTVDGKKVFNWSHSDTVSLLKHVARHHMLCVSKEDAYEWSEYERKHWNQERVPLSRKECLRARQAREESGQVRPRQDNDNQL
jgi:hypothetical protein